MANFFDDSEDVSDNPFAGLDPVLTPAPAPGLSERFDMNFRAGLSQNTVLGAAYDASTEGRRAERRRFDRSYESFPEWQGPFEGLAAISGQIAGTAASIENFVPVGLGAAIVARSKGAVTGLWARTFAGAVDAAATNAVADAAIQGIELGAGHREQFDPLQYGASVLLGGAIGGAGGAAAHALPRALARQAPENANPFASLDEAPGAPEAAIAVDAARAEAGSPTAESGTAPVPEVPAASAPADGWIVVATDGPIGETLSRRAAEARGLAEPSPAPARTSTPSPELSDPVVELRGLIEAAPARDLDQIYEAAPGWQQQLDDLGKAVAADTGAEWRNPGIKAREGAAEKMTRKGYADTRRLTDVVRGGYVVDTPDQADAIAASLAGRFRIVDEGWNTNSFGYTDRKLMVVFEDGSIGEVQIWPRKMLEAKENTGHALYKQARSLSDDDPAKIDLVTRQREVYSAVTADLSPDWLSVISEGSGGRPGKMALNLSSDTIYPLSATSSERTRTQPAPSPSTANALAPEAEMTAGRSSQLTKENDIGSTSKREVSTNAENVKSDASGPEQFLQAAPQTSLTGQRVRVASAATEAEATMRIARVRETAEALALALDVAATRQGRISGGRRVLGTFDTADGVVRVRNLDDFDVLSHEYGHHLDARIPAVKQFIKTHSADLKKLDYDPVAGRDYEGFAEFFRLWLTNRAYLQQNLPALAAEFERVIRSADAAMAKAIDDAADAWSSFIAAPSSVAVRSTIVSSKKEGWIKSAPKDLPGIRGTIAEVLQRMYTFLFDDLHPINRAVSHLQALHLENTGKALDLKVTDDAYKMARMSRGAYSAGHMDVIYGVAPYRGMNPESPSLRDAIIEATGKPNAFAGWDEEKVGEFGSYLWSRRALGEWERFRAGEIPNPPDKLTEADHLQNIRELTVANPTFVAAATKVHEFARALWKKKYDAGLIDAETYERGLLIKDYVPGLRDFSGDSDLKVGGQKRRGGSMKGGMVKRFQGSKRDVINPLESLAADAYETAMTIARNDVVKALHRLSLTAGIGGGGIAELVPARELRPHMVDPIQAVQSAAKSAGLADADVVVLRDAVESAVGSEKAAVFRPAAINEKGEPIVFFRDGGELKALRLADGEFGLDMYRALTGMNQHEKNFWLELVSMPARVVRMGITTTPEFIGANFVRDQVLAWVYYGKPFRRLGLTLRGAADDLAGNSVARSYSRLYGISGGAETSTLSTVMAKRDIAGLRRKGWVARVTSGRKFLETTELAETATRLGLFRTFREEALKRGLDEYEALMEASWRARDYIDFDRRGSGMAALSRITPFLNASLQGLDKTSRHMIMPIAKKMIGEALSVEDQAAIGMAVKAWARLATLTAGSVSLYALMSRHEDHNEVSETTRATHWMVRSGDNWLAVPKPHELAVVVNLAEALFDSWAQEDPAAMRRWRDSLFSTLMPPSIIESNPGIKTYFELRSNKNFFTDAPVVPDQLAGMEPWLQYTARTSMLSRQLGEMFGASPVVADHVITNHLGSWGRNLLSLYDLAQPDAPRFAWDDAPFSRRFIKDASKGSQSVTKFWELAGQQEGRLEGKVKSWKSLAEAGDAAGAADYYAGLKPIEQAYVAVSALDAGSRRLHPMMRARGGIQAVGVVRRELAAGRVTDENGNPVKVSPAERTAADDILSDLAMAMSRNALKEAGVEGWAQRKEMDETGYYRELEAVSPALARRLGDAFAEKRIWSWDAVKSAWPELRRRALADGSAAFTSDLVIEVESGGLALDGTRRGRKPRPVLEIPD